MPKHDSTPEIVVALEVSPSLALEDSLSRTISAEISHGLTEILRVLGLPGDPTVRITPQQHKDKLLDVVVTDERCPYPEELLWQVYSYVKGTPLSRVHSAEILKTAEDSPVEFLRLACLEIIKRQPTILLGPAQVAAYRTSLPTPDSWSGPWPPSSDRLLPVLRHALSCRLSIADQRLVAGVLGEGLAKERSQDEVVENLVAALRPDVVKIQLPTDYLRQITVADSGGEHDKFTTLRDGLFYESGLRYPNFRFVPVDNLKPSSFALEINHLTTLPRIGLPPGQCLVNDTPERLRLVGLDGKTAINPANGNECSLIASENQSTAASIGLTSWDPMGYLVLSMSVDLRENGACFVHRQVVQNELEQLEMAFPALVKAVQTRFSLERVTQVLRALATEEISIRNLRLILEGLLDYDYIVTDPLNFIIFDDRLPTYEEPSEAWLNHPANLTSFVRIGMKRYISHKYTRGQSTLIVYLLDPEIEKVLSKAHAYQTSGIHETGLSVEERSRILEAVRAEVGTLPRSASTPAILTTVDIRPALREIIVPEFPRLPVLAYQELSSSLNIQPIARISWN